MDDSSSITSRLRQTVRPFARIWRGAFVIVVGGWLVWLLVKSDYADAALLHDWGRWEVAVFAFAWYLLPLGLAMLWRWSVQFSSHLQLSIADCLLTQGLAWGGRYLPGKAGLWLAKVSVRSSGNGTWRFLGRTVLVEQMYFVLAGLLVGLVFMPWELLLQLEALRPMLPAFIIQLQGGASLTVLVASSVAIVFIAALCWVILLERYLKLPRVPNAFFRWLGVLLGHTVLHVVVGASLYPLIVLFLPSAADLMGWQGVVAALALANSLGVLAVFAPAGLGVREVVLAVCLSSQAGVSAALSVAAFLRVLTFFVDVIFASSAWICGFLLRKNTRVTK